MAAPSTTEWGAVKGSGNKQGRIGINQTIIKTNDKITVKIDIYYWTKFAVDDKTNTFKYGWGTSAGTVSATNKHILTKNGESWGTFNQVFISSHTTEFARGTSAVTKYASASFSGIEYGGGSGSVTVEIKVPAKESYTITYNANGGTGAPSSQSKPQGVSITLSNTIPVRNGYTFLGWGTSSTATTVAYKAGGTYSANASATLYAVWKANIYTVTYDANGGTGAPASQTKTHGVVLKLSSTVPTRTDYKFVGWGVTADSTTAVYNPGDAYESDMSATLYAIWVLAFNKPRIENYTVQRCDSSGNYQADGKYCKVKFDWKCDSNVVSIKVEYKLSSDEKWTATNIEAFGLSGKVNEIIGGSLNPLSAYNIRVTVTDAHESSSYAKPLSSKKRVLECRGDRDGVTFGGTADETGLVSNWDLKLKTGRIITPDALEVDGLVPSDESKDIGKPDTTFNNVYLKNLYINGRNHTEQKILWSGGYFMTASHTATLSEPISNQHHGIILVFTPYVDNEVKTYDRNPFFVPKQLVSMHAGQSMSFIMTGSMPGNIFANKCLIFNDTKISGHKDNSFVGRVVGSDIYVQNNKFVLQYVIGI